MKKGIESFPCELCVSSEAGETKKPLSLAEPAGIAEKNPKK